MHHFKFEDKHTDTQTSFPLYRYRLAQTRILKIWRLIPNLNSCSTAKWLSNEQSAEQSEAVPGVSGEARACSALWTTTGPSAAKPYIWIKKRQIKKGKLHCCSCTRVAAVGGIVKKSNVKPSHTYFFQVHEGYFRHMPNIKNTCFIFIYYYYCSKKGLSIWHIFPITSRPIPAKLYSWKVLQKLKSSHSLFILF